MQHQQEQSLNQHDSFLWAYYFTDGSASPVDLLGLKATENEPGFTWVHLQSDSIDAEQTMYDLGLSKNVADSLIALETRPKTLSIDGGLVVYLRGINTNPDADPEDMVSLLLPQQKTVSHLLSYERRGAKRRKRCLKIHVPRCLLQFHGKSM